jgi:hypothetical protein
MLGANPAARRGAVTSGGSLCARVPRWRSGGLPQEFRERGSRDGSRKPLPRLTSIRSEACILLQCRPPGRPWSGAPWRPRSRPQRPLIYNISAGMSRSWRTQCAPGIWRSCAVTGSRPSCPWQQCRRR